MHVLLSVTAVCKPSVTAFELTLEGFLACMSPFVDLQVFRASEHFSTAGEWTRERLFAGVDPNVVYQFIFGLERLAFPRAVFPKADVISLLRSANVLYGDVRDQLVHRAKSFVAALLGVAQLLGVDPLTDQLLLDALLPHVTEEGTGVVCCHVHTHVHIHGAVLVVKLCGGVGVGPRTGHLVVLVRAPEHFPGQSEAHLAVEHIGGSVGAVLVVDPGEQNVALSVCVGVMQGSRRGAKNSVLAARRRGFSKAAAAKQKVPGGVERGASIGRDMSVRTQRRSGVTRRLTAERRALSRGEVVVEFKCTHVSRVYEAVLSQTQVSVLHVARGVMPSERTHSQSGKLVTSVQQHDCTFTKPISFAFNQFRVK